MTLNNKLSLNSVYFECDHVRTERRPRVEQANFIGLCVALVLLVIVLFLQLSAKCSVSITVKHIPLQCIGDLFKHAPPGDPDGHYFLNQDAGDKLGGADLRSLRLKKLVGVRHQQLKYEPEDAPLEEPCTHGATCVRLCLTVCARVCVCIKGARTSKHMFTMT